MDRRGFLSLTGLGLTGLAGCTSTDSGTSTTSEPPARDLHVEFSGLQAGVIEMFVDAYQITSDPDSQYLFLNVTVTSDPAPERSVLTFHFNGEEFPAKTEWDHPPLHRGEDSTANYPDVMGEKPYWGEKNKSGWAVFQLPESGDASDAVFEWPDGQWRPGGEVRTRLATPLPSFVIEEFSVPETIPLDSAPIFEFTVRNEGNQPGHFIGAIHGQKWTTGIAETFVSQRIPPSESKSWEVAGKNIAYEEYKLEQPNISYTLLWRGENISRSAKVTEQ